MLYFNTDIPAVSAKGVEIFEDFLLVSLQHGVEGLWMDGGRGGDAVVGDPGVVQHGLGPRLPRDAGPSRVPRRLGARPA